MMGAPGHYGKPGSPRNARRRLVLRAGVLALNLAAAAAAAQGWSITSAGILSDPALPEGLGGITYAGGERYYAVDDSGGRLYTLKIVLENSGAISSAAAIATNICTGGVDLEGVAWDRFSNAVYVGDEVGPAIREHAATGGVAQATLAIPEVFQRHRPNYSLESLSMSPDGLLLWTANEEALLGDGLPASTSTPSVVRLQRWARDTPQSPWRPAGQWACQTSRLSEASPFSKQLRCGVVDLCALPGGHLLLLERELGGYIPTFRSRLFILGFAGATDVAQMPALRGAAYTPVSRTLLWEADCGPLDNFEGLGLGPPLPGGGRSLILVGDGDPPQRPSLHALVLRQPR